MQLLFRNSNYIKIHGNTIISLTVTRISSKWNYANNDPIYQLPIGDIEVGNIYILYIQYNTTNLWE